MAVPSRDALSPDALALLVMGETGVFTCPLPMHGEITFGRSEACDVHVEDPKLSRRHALLRVTGGATPRVEVIDLGSLNGTVVGERRLAPHVPVHAGLGEMIALGGTVLVVQSGEQTSRKWRLWSLAEVRQRLGDECDRAARGETEVPFALVKVRFRNARDADPIEDVLGDSLRKKDLVASAGPGEYEVLLVETPESTANALASRITTQLRERGVDVEMHVAIYPRDGDTPELLEDSEGATPRPAHSGNGVDITGGSAMKRLEPVIEKIAASTINVLVLGETGVGKEVLARSIHTRSPRAGNPLLCINCAALSEALLESELFGHERGSFTGAIASKVGLLESAEGGTVFLDEVGEMPLPLQAKLLRVLEQREVMRVGALKPRPIDVRFIAATNRDLEAESARGRFRQDLFFRLNGISVVIPPLRHRVDEIEPLARIFLQQAAATAGRSGEMRFSREAMALLKRYAWPGNVRELRNIVERAVLLSTGETITLEHLPCEKMGPVVEIRLPRVSPSGTMPTIPPSSFAARELARARHEREAAFAYGERDSETEQIAIPDARGRNGDARPSSPGLSGANGPGGPGGPEEERRRIIHALERCAGNQTQAAKILGISRRTLVTRLSTYDLPRPRKKPPEMP